MPTKLPSPCSKAGCPETTTASRCDEHKRQKNKRDEERWDRQNREFYSSVRWQKLRKKQLSRQPVCEGEECDRAATEVDHITPIADGGEKWDMENLQSLCKSCHSSKTYEETIGDPSPSPKE